MNKHKHYEMIVAKAANMELVVFMRQPEAGCTKWSESNFNGLVNYWKYDYFLCLPQHKEACLHWLNGGEVQEKGIDADINSWSDEYESVVWSKGWHDEHVLMDDSLVTRIKPRKEKRFAIVGNDFRMGVMTFPTKKELEDHYFNELSNGQIVEFEVEV